MAEDYLSYFDFTSLNLVEAMRKFFNHFVLIGETQERERVLSHFTRRYLTCTPELLENHHISEGTIINNKHCLSQTNHLFTLLHPVSFQTCTARGFGLISLTGVKLTTVLVCIEPISQMFIQQIISGRLVSKSAAIRASAEVASVTFTSSNEGFTNESFSP